MEIFEAEREYGPHKLTRIVFRKDGKTCEFLAGRHVTKARIMILAQTLQLKER